MRIGESSIELGAPNSARHFSTNGTIRSISSCSEIGGRLVRALSPPTSIMSAPSATIRLAIAIASSGSSVPSPENESGLRLIMPITTATSRDRACDVAVSAQANSSCFIGGPVSSTAAFGEVGGDLPRRDDESPEQSRPSKSASTSPAKVAARTNWFRSAESSHPRAPRVGTARF